MAEPERLLELSQRLDETARRLREPDVDGDQASQLAGQCAELASQAAAELDRVVRTAPDEPAPGQEELL